MRISDWNSDVCSSDLQRGYHVLGIEFGAVMESDAFAQIEFPMRRIDCPPFGRQLREIFGGTTAVDQGVPNMPGSGIVRRRTVLVRIKRRRRRGHADRKPCVLDRKSTRLNSSH